MTTTPRLGTAEIRRLRGPKTRVDPWRPIATLAERERTRSGGSVPSFTIFLAGSECPFTCVFCDLWRYTLDEPTPAGAIPRQIELALRELETPPEDTTLKLYNASNFFDDRAVPPGDDEAILPILERFDRVVVECHPRLIHDRFRSYARRLGRRLEVAFGLETSEPQILARLNKKMPLYGFETSTRIALNHGVSVRVFVLVGVPYSEPEGSSSWRSKAPGTLRNEERGTSP